MYLYLSPSVCPSNYLPKTVTPAPPSWRKGSNSPCLNPDHFSWEKIILGIHSQETPFEFWVNFFFFFLLPCVLDAEAGIRGCCLGMQRSIPALLSAYTVAKAPNPPF